MSIAPEPPKDMSALRHSLRVAVKDGWSLAELARRTDTHYTSWLRFWNGERDLSGQYVLILIKELESYHASKS